MEYEGLLGLIKQRRSIRRYEREPVPLEDVMKVLEAARWAPSGDNSQPWEFVVVRDGDMLNKVMDVLVEAGRECREACPRFSFVRPERLSDASTLIIVCADARFKGAYPGCDEGHELAEMYEENSERILIESVTHAVAFMSLAAASLGLGTVCLTSPGERVTAQRLRAILDIPEALQPICCLPLGFPGKKKHSGISPTKRVPRPLETMVHMNRFDKRKWRTGEDLAKHTRIGRKAWAHFYRTGQMP
ncbi:MAG: nitroreductase family protein [Deltaproteobacteria bacterium]|nr:nitroreductase family protein [Deltaproteobacteria bacterium]